MTKSELISEIYPCLQHKPKFNWKPFVIAVFVFIALVCWFTFVWANISYKLSDHFQSSELACHHCGECKVSFELIIALEKLRNKVNQPIIITSGYRCSLHNKKVNGAKNSQHLYGNAVDIKIKGYTPSQVEKLAKECGFTWTKTYVSWTHIDIRPIQLTRRAK